MASLIHETLLAAIPGIRRRRMRKYVTRQLRAAFGHPSEADEVADVAGPDYIDDLFDGGILRPDGYTLAIDAELETVELVIYEAEVSHPLDERRLRLYADLWFAFDTIDAGWKVRLVCVDRYGRHNETNLCGYHYALLADERDPEKPKGRGKGKAFYAGLAEQHGHDVTAAVAYINEAP